MESNLNKELLSNEVDHSELQDGIILESSKVYNTLSSYLEEKLMLHPIVVKYKSLEKNLESKSNPLSNESKSEDTSQTQEINQQRNIIKMIKPIVEIYVSLVSLALASIRNSEFDMDISDLLSLNKDRSQETENKSEEIKKAFNSLETIHSKISSIASNTNTTTNLYSANINIIQLSIFEYLSKELISHLQSKLMSIALLRQQKKKILSTSRSELIPKDREEDSIRDKFREKMGDSLQNSDISSVLKQVQQDITFSKLFEKNISNLIKQPGVEETVVKLAPWSLLNRSIRMQTVPTAHLWIDQMKAYQRFSRQNQFYSNSKTLHDDDFILQSLFKNYNTS